MKGLVVCLPIALVACMSEAPVPEHAPTSGDELLSLMERALVESRFDNWVERDLSRALSRRPVVRQLYWQSEENEQFLRSILEDAAVDVRTKILAVWIAQCLPLERYLAFVELIVGEVSSGRLPSRVLAQAILPDEEWGPGLAEDYRIPLVVDLLSRIEAANVLTGEGLQVLASVSSGDAARYSTHLREEGLRPGRLACLRHEDREEDLRRND